MLKKPFFQLKPQKMKVVDGFSLDTKILEEEMKKFNGGIDISTMKHGEWKEDESYRELVTFCYQDNATIANEDAIMNIALKYPSINDPCAMQLNSEEELMDVMLVAYQVSHFHYILGMINKWKGGAYFPRSCCARSAHNLGVSLMDLGLPNTAILYAEGPDDATSTKERWFHCYDAIPFVLGEIKGSVIVDPTSNQYTHELGANAVFIKLGAEWEYHVNPDDERNFYPKTICSLDILKNHPEAIDTRRYNHRLPKAYFLKAFANPVRVPFSE